METISRRVHIQDYLSGKEARQLEYISFIQKKKTSPLPYKLLTKAWSMCPSLLKAWTKASLSIWGLIGI